MAELRHVVVRIMRGVEGGSNSDFLGTGIVIAPRLVITAKHVLENSETRQFFPHQEIFLRSDFDAWPEGGPQGIQEPIFHPEMDIALLTLGRISGLECWAETASNNQEIQIGQEVEVHGYSHIGAGLEILRANISSYGGGWNLFSCNAPGRGGFSGGPVFCDRTLVGIITRVEAGITHFLPIGSLRPFLERHVTLIDLDRRLRPITDRDNDELKQLLASLEIPDDVAETFFHKLVKDSPFHKKSDGQRLFDQFLDWLAKSYNRGNVSPYLVFLGACQKRAKFDHNLNKDLLAQFHKWLENAIIRVRISQESLDTQIQNLLTPIKDTLAILSIKVAPNQEDVTQSSYLMNAWVAHTCKGEKRGGVSDNPLVYVMLDGVGEGPIGRDCLAGGVREAVKICLKKLGPTFAAMTLRIEIILPLELFDWNPDGVELSTSNSLLVSYPVVFRSWERNYHWLEDPFAEPQIPNAWLYKCQSLPDHKLMSHHFCYANETEGLAEQIHDEIWALLAPHPFNGIQGRVKEILLTGLFEGLPYMLWPLTPAFDSPESRHTLMDWLQLTRHQEWPETLHRERRDNSRHPEWRNLALLWDDPNRPTPDRDYPLIPTV